MPDTKVLWSPRVGFNWDVTGNQTTQVRGGTGLFSGRPAYVWISNQVGNTGVLIGERIDRQHDGVPVQPEPGRLQAGQRHRRGRGQLYAQRHRLRTSSSRRSGAATSPSIASCPGGIISTTELIYSKDVNGIYYINANLPAAQSAFTGADNRPRWVGTPCAAAGQQGGCVTRLNNVPGNQVTVNYVLKNESEGRSWNFAQSLAKTTRFGLSVRGAYSYGVSKSLSDPESTAATSFGRATRHSADPNNPGLSYSLWSPGHRVFALVNYSREYFHLGATGVSLFWEARQSTINSSSRLSYVFAGDMNGDSVAANDLIYIPRDQSEMTFVPVTAQAAGCSPPPSRRSRSTRTSTRTRT